MKKALRFISLVLCVLLLSGLTAAQAELITLGISLTGVVSEGGTVRTVTPEGKFRVYQNGREIGEIAAGRETVTVNNTDTIRIEPLPQTFDPAWDLSTAYMTPDVSGSGSVIVPVTLWVLGAEHDPAAEISGIPAEDLIPGRIYSLYRRSSRLRNPRRRRRKSRPRKHRPRRRSRNSKSKSRRKLPLRRFR